jgi:hypothetical protein
MSDSFWADGREELGKALREQGQENRKELLDQMNQLKRILEETTYPEERERLLKEIDRVKAQLSRSSSDDLDQCLF